MKNYAVSLTGILFLLVFLLNSCNQEKKTSTQITNDSRFTEYIKSHTEGQISRKDKISVQFAKSVLLPGNLEQDQIFNINPAVNGSVVKTGAHTLVFSPKEDLKAGQQYIFKIKLNKLVPDIPRDLNEYVFAVQTLEQNYDVEVYPIQTPDPTKPDMLSLEGVITTADFVEDDAIEKILSLSEELEVKWTHLSSTSHRFAITGIKRAKEKRTLTISSSGSPIGIKESRDLTITIPSVQVFSLISTKISKSGNPYVSIYFSDPLDSKQNLKGLVQLEGLTNPSMIVSGNELKIYVPKNTSGSKKLEISEGLKNSSGKTLGKIITSYVAFEPEKPALKLVGNGTILPSTDGMVLPFEAVNLKAVQVEVLRIFEDNLPQYFQVNSYKGEDELNRVGRKVSREKVSLEGKAADLSAWNRFTLDLSGLFTAEPGALYQIRIGFKPEYTNYPCDKQPETSGPNRSVDQSWSIYDDDGFNSWRGIWSYQYPYDYSWSERDNPCHVSYYIPDKFVKTSLYATDIGLITKIGADNSVNIFTTDLTTAGPVQASVKVLDFQLQEMVQATTDAHGQATIRPEKRPFLIVAEAKGQKSYLRLMDNESLSTSNFDVSGSRVEGNIKGYIYGERGVWRPGDNIYLSFMLEDPADRIPADHPVILELCDPKGNVKDHQVATNSVSGLYSFQTQTSPEDVTGNWQAKVTIGSRKFYKTVKIETIKPNRLKIDLNLDKRIAYDQRNLAAPLHVDWLTGLKGSNLKTEIELRLSETKTSFEGFAQYLFDDETKSYFKDPEQVFSGKVDENGDASVNIPLPDNPKSPGALKAVFNTKVFEPGGGFSINSKTVTYLPYSSFVGINLTTLERWNRIKRDQPQELQIVTLDADGKPINRQDLEFSLYRLNWRWWWDQSDDYTTNYLSSSYATRVQKEKISTAGGKGKVNFTVKSPDWGRFIAVVKDPVSGHSASKIFYTSWYGDSKNSLGASSLQVNTDKEEYTVGEKINVSLKGGLEGQALVCVENGSTVLQSFWVKSENEWTTFSIDVTPEMAPNAYLNVTLLQPHRKTTNDLPMRLYGIAPIKVVDKATILEPQLKMPDELAPLEPVEITITEKNGKPMAYTVAVVDEGLLDITNFQTPAPWAHFYSKEALGVKTWDLYNDVIGAYGGQLERLLAVGGGEGGRGDAEKKQENRFKPVVQFMGPYYLEAGKSKKHSFTMPQYIGSVKTMVVAGLNGAYGHADKATPVIKPLMVLGTLPRVVGPGEQISLPVNVFRFKENLRNAKITIEASGVLSLVGQKSKSISMDKETETVYFDLTVAEKIGTGKVTITASSGNETAKHEINIMSRSPNAPQTLVNVIPIEGGKTKTLSADLFGVDGTNKVTLEIASIPPINLESRLRYLIRYPHGCIEQTVSSVFPQLFLADIMKLSNEQSIKIESHVKTAIKKLNQFKVSSGGLGYWPGYDHANSWGTNYAYHFLIEARKKGYMVPNDLMDGIRDFQRTKARNWTKPVDDDYRRDSELIQAYRLFTLAIGGYAELGAMNRLRNISQKPVEATHKLAAAYAVTGQTEAAKQLIKDKGRSSLKEHSYSYYYYSYGSFARDLAMLLESYVYMDDQQNAFTILKELSDRLSSDRWMSTQTTAYSLLAIAKYVEANKVDQGIKTEISYGKTTINWSTQQAIYQDSIPAEQSKSVQIKNLGEANIFATLTVSGIPKAGEEPVGSTGLDVNIRYADINGRTIRPDSLPLGKSFDIYITVKNQYEGGQVRDIALSHILPSGWEIQNDRLNDNEPSSYSSFDFQDIRDDRVYTYFYLDRDGSRTYKVGVTAAYPGKYYLPGILVEAMYKASISSKQAGKWIVVTD